MTTSSNIDVKRSIHRFLDGEGKNKGRAPDERYASFDYCYGYFHSFYKADKLHELADEKNIKNSCLHLGFYLASWGMLRGSSFLLEKSARNLKAVIEVIANSDPVLWEIDVDSYTEENIDLLLECRRQLIEALGKNNTPSDTLITKIMLGVYANIPAFDQYFRKTLGVHSVNKKTLRKLHDFYKEHRSEFDSFTVYVLDFCSGKETKTKYTKAKLLDMYGFMG